MSRCKGYILHCCKGLSSLRSVLAVCFPDLVSRVQSGTIWCDRTACKRGVLELLSTALSGCQCFTFRDVHALWGDPEFAPLLVIAPERHYADANKMIRVYFDMHTGKWWWATQKEIEKTHPGATIIPLIISSDKTQLTLFGSKAAYPVYLTIGNLPKEIRRKPSRRGQILLAYLPTSSLGHIKNKSARRRALANLFHACMKRILAPLKDAGENGMRMLSGDGKVRRCHPILAVYVGDYPEQLLVTCRKTGDCPKCPALLNELDDLMWGSRHLRNLKEVHETLSTRDEGPAAFTRACKEAHMRPIVEPFWEDLPYVNIFAAITPDILHQLYQGVIKHVVSWLKAAYGTEEIDARCRRFPPNHHIRLFMKGITSLRKVTGKMHADICRFLLGLIIGLPLRGGLSPVRVVRAVRALLDFLYLAQYPVHTDETLQLLNDALARFHVNKQIFKDLGIREHFNFPKLHALWHYIFSITRFGTTDNYDTQYSERLHIDLAKDAYRATNHKDEYPQMTDWLLRKEKIEQYDAFCRWLGVAGASSSTSRSTGAPQVPGEHLHTTMARYPSVKAVTFETAAREYGATYLRSALARFIALRRYPDIHSASELERRASRVHFGFRTLPVWHRIKFKLEDILGFGIGDDCADAIHAQPKRTNKRGRQVPGRFDTALVKDGDGSEVGRRVGQVRLVFKIPRDSLHDLLPDVADQDLPSHLAYIEWFSPFTRPDPNHGLYKVTRTLQGTQRLASIVEVQDIHRSCHLWPDFGPVVPRHWTSSNVLDCSTAFYVSPFSDRAAYQTII
ncbi:hypothetical protein DAEQUDRAFT_714317 [Daedalea quercina L-15889]|uniref:Uncharacterized protein n=1 Tax=Daedalea quercina L-15889 TaxID=1314783 RepID=A0A165NCF5_9APHY|nr:hypothetical protein DAEQUDRAFT_714317 [Daedalea quercina L-15889]